MMLRGKQGPDPEHLSCHGKEYTFYTKYDGKPQEGNRKLLDYKCFFKSLIIA